MALAHILVAQGICGPWLFPGLLHSEPSAFGESICYAFSDPKCLSRLLLLQRGRIIFVVFFL